MNEQQDLFEDLLPRPPGLQHLEKLHQAQAGLPERLFLGTTSWTSEDWEGLVYPQGCTSQDYIEHYARVFGAVEVDSTWYRIPSPRMVEGWLRRTPQHFKFAAKVPRAITHEKGMVDCGAEMEEFLAVMSRLQERLGPLLLQFEYIARGRNAREYEYGEDFLDRLGRFLPSLPTDEFDFAVEVRNGKWVRRGLVDLLAQHRVTLALTSYYTMPGIAEVRQKLLDPVTADFLYVRFLGDRKQMDAHVQQLIETGAKKRQWDELLWDRRAEIEDWVKHLKELIAQQPGLATYAFFNNHYAGYAPGSLEMFARAWKGL
jgi:uncharacterized protein YecE (DUF72 family)